MEPEYPPPGHEDNQPGYPPPGHRLNPGPPDGHSPLNTAEYRIAVWLWHQAAEDGPTEILLEAQPALTCSVLKSMAADELRDEAMGRYCDTTMLSLSVNGRPVQDDEPVDHTWPGLTIYVQSCDDYRIKMNDWIAGLEHRGKHEAAEVWRTALTSVARLPFESADDGTAGSTEFMEEFMKLAQRCQDQAEKAFRSAGKLPEILADCREQLPCSKSRSDALQRINEILRDYAD